MEKIIKQKPEEAIYISAENKLAYIGKENVAKLTFFDGGTEAQIYCHKINNKLFVTVWKDQDVQAEIKVLNFSKPENQQILNVKL